MRIGHGYDVHKLVEGRKLILGGVEIPYEKGLLGHSDADVLTHALMDALLGAAASCIAGDIVDIARSKPSANASSLPLISLKSQQTARHGVLYGAMFSHA